MEYFLIENSLKYKLINELMRLTETIEGYNSEKILRIRKILKIRYNLW